MINHIADYCKNIDALTKVAKMTDGYSCSDLTNLAKDAAMAPLREIPTAHLVTIKPEDMRQIGLKVTKMFAFV